MTIAATSRMDYVGSNTLATYAFTYPIVAASDLLVTKRDTAGVETTLALNTDYTVAGVGVATGGSITLLAGNLPTSYALTIRRVVSLAQAVDIRNQSGFFPDVLENEFDKLASADQQEQDGIDRSLRAAETDPAITRLPAVAQRLGKFLAFDAGGNPTVSAGSGGGDTSLRTDLAASGGSALLGFIQAGVGAVLQTIQSLFRAQPLTPEAFGAVRDGVTDDLAAFNRLATALVAQGKSRAQLQAGNYYLSGTWDTTSVQQIIVDGAGLNATTVTSGATTTPGITYANTSSLASQFRNFQLRQSGLVLPAVARAGNYGFASATSGTGAGCILERVGVRYFGDSAIRIAGPTGPTSILDSYLYSCAGYGVTIDTVAGQSPQNVKIRDGAIQTIWGGIRVNAGTAVIIDGPDIELGANGKYPALYIAENAGAGCVVTCLSPTFSVGSGAITAPAGIVVVEGQSIGCVIVGGLNAAPNGTNNYLLGNSVTGTANLTVIGGYHSNKNAGGGYFCEFTGATDVAFLQPFLVASSYTAGKNVVHDVAGNFVTAVGVACSTVAGSGAGKVVVAGRRVGVTAAIATAATVAHGLSTTPTVVLITALDSGPTNVYVTAIGGTTFTVNFGGGGSHVFGWSAEA